MKTNRLRYSTAGILAILLALLLAPLLHAQALFNGTDAYTQDFDSLPIYTGTGTATFTFTNNSNINNNALIGWYSSVGTGSANAVSSAGARKDTGDLYNWGASGSSDRALGLHSYLGYAAGTAFLGLQLQNTSATTINSITLTFDVEQWRRNQTAALWTFGYLVTANAGDQLEAAGYQASPDGNAASKVTGTAGAFAGNSNVTHTTVTLTGLNWQPGEFLWLRWESDVSGSTSCGIGLDNLKVEVSQVPEPSTIALLLGTLVFVLTLIRRQQT